MLEWRKICCAVDFSESSRLALLKGAELARRLEAELELLHVHTLPAAAATDMLVTPADVQSTALLEPEETMAKWQEEGRTAASVKQAPVDPPVSSLLPD